MPVWIREDTYSDWHGQHEGYLVEYQSPTSDVVGKLAFDLDTTLEEIEEAVARHIKEDRELSEEFDLVGSSLSYTPLYSGQHNAIFSVTKVILSTLSHNVKVWLDGLTKQVQQKYPRAYVGFSTEDKTWVIFDGGGLQGGIDNLLFSVGLFPSGEYGYVCRSKGKLLSGKTKELDKLKQLFLNLEV